jgi:dipeptidyl aminopeptidase/acylaminoacyl peptidase
VGGVVYAQSHGLAQPPEIVRFPLAGGEVEPVTTFAGEALSAIAFGRVEELEIAGADGDPVHVFLVFPPGYEAGAPRPLVQVLHGGPYGMHGDLWSFRWNAQTFAAPGHVVAMVNFHGSAGYGSRFADSVMGNWGGAPAEDILLATDALVARGVADPARLALAGGSYGGYLAAWLPTRTDRFRCTVVHAPVFNTGTLCSGDMTQGVERELGGEPWSMPATREPIDRWNPAMHTASYTTPTLVTHGGKDYRCPVENGFELYGVLKAKGVSARLAHYPDEGHWILKRRHSIHWYGEVLGWIGRHLA